MYLRTLWKADKGIKIYAENFEKLQELKRRYGPNGGLKPRICTEYIMLE